MGIDACIFVKTKDGQEPRLCDSLPVGAEIGTDAFLLELDSDTGTLGATYRIFTYWSYYGPGYERGPWPLIAATLLALYASENTETVWYFGDNMDNPEPFTSARLQEFNEHYMANGNRPYVNRPKSLPTV